MGQFVCALQRMWLMSFHAAIRDGLQNRGLPRLLCEAQKCRFRRRHENNVYM